MKSKNLINLIGTAAVIVGVFSPLINIPIIGSISYASQQQGEGFILIGAVLVGALCAVLKVYWPSIISGLLVIFDSGWTLTNLANITHRMGNSDNPFSRAFSNVISPSWAFAFLLIGAAMLIISVLLKADNVAAAALVQTGQRVTQPIDAQINKAIAIADMSARIDSAELVNKLASYTTDSRGDYKRN
jgi:hypothetical protein